MNLFSLIPPLTRPSLSRWQVIKAGLVLLCLGMLLLSGQAAPVQAAGPGDLDLTFDGDGWVTTSFNGQDYSSIQAIARQTDGKLVVAGYAGANGLGTRTNSFALARYNPDGSLDTSFDGDGLVATVFSDPSGNVRLMNEAYDLIIQPDGKLVVAGYTSSYYKYFALARYNPDGSLDTTFDSDGKVTTEVVSFADNVTYALLLQADGKLVAAGMAAGNFALARYNPNGSLDTTFSDDGLVTTDFGGADVANDLVVQTDGKLVAAGYAFFGGGDNDFALVRYNADGSLDTSFDNDGMVNTSLGFANVLALQPDGKLIAAGYLPGFASDSTLARYNPNGSLDNSFGNDGWMLTDLGGDDQINDLVLQPDGKVVVAAKITDSSYQGDFALAGYTADGRLDTSIGGDGIITTDLGADDKANAGMIQPDGKLVVAGYSGYDCYSFDCDDFDFALARYHYLLPEIEVGGNGELIPDGDASPTLTDATDFGSVVLTNSGYATYNIYNTGGLNLTLTGSPTITITGPAAADFSQMYLPATLIAPGDYTYFGVRFTPRITGPRVATITIANNDSDENPYNFRIQGTGIDTLATYLPLVLK